MADLDEHQLSEEQLAIARAVQHGSGNLLVVARAGSGKTYIIRRCVPLMVGRVAIAAYNKGIKDEIKAKVADAGDRANVETFHAFGYRRCGARSTGPS